MLGSIETARLLLRAPQESDAEAMLLIRNSDFVQRFNAMKVIDLERMCGQIRRDLDRNAAYYIVRKSDGVLIGGVWMEEDDSRYEVNSIYLSFYLAEAFARQGYMKEALGAVIDTLFVLNSGLELVASSVFSENAASENLLRSVGFTCEGCVRKAVRDPRGLLHDDVKFSLLREEWEVKREA